MATIVLLIVIIGILAVLALAVRSLMNPDQDQGSTLASAASDRFRSTTEG